MPYQNKKNGSQYLTIGEMGDMFYRSRFNHDPLCDFEEGEDPDDSSRHRLYNKKDVKAVMKAFFDFFGWAITEKNISRVYLSSDLTLMRESRFPRIKRANNADVLRKQGSVKAGELYLTQGKYSWLLWTEGEVMENLKKLQETDPEFIAAREEKQKELDERIKNEKHGNE